MASILHLGQTFPQFFSILFLRLLSLVCAPEGAHPNSNYTPACCCISWLPSPCLRSNPWRRISSACNSFQCQCLQLLMVLPVIQCCLQCSQFLGRKQKTESTKMVTTITITTFLHYILYILIKLRTKKYFFLVFLQFIFLSPTPSWLWRLNPQLSPFLGKKL